MTRFYRRAASVDAVRIDREVEPLQPDEYLEAETPSTDMPNWLVDAMEDKRVTLGILAGEVQWRVLTPAGDRYAKFGDWIVLGPDGDLGRWKPDLFHETFTAAA